MIKAAVELSNKKWIEKNGRKRWIRRPAERESLFALQALTAPLNWFTAPGPSRGGERRRAVLRGESQGMMTGTGLNDEIDPSDASAAPATGRGRRGGAAASAAGGGDELPPPSSPSSRPHKPVSLRDVAKTA